jgi:2-dehydropantoate 2-reductase
MAREDKTIVIAGAGSVGCYAGGCLASAGRQVVLLARPRIGQALWTGGLRVTDLDGRDRLVKADALVVTADPEVALPGADVILVTVKSGDTEDMAGLIAAHAPPDAVVVSLQNGVDNADRLRVVSLAVGGCSRHGAFQCVSESLGGELPLRVHRASDGKVDDRRGPVRPRRTACRWARG